MNKKAELTLNGFLIGLIFFIASAIISLTFVTDMYNSEGYDINLSDDKYTQHLSALQTEAETAQISTQIDGQQIWNKTIGQDGANIKSGSIDEGDLMISSYQSLKSTGTFLDVFVGLGNSFFSVLGLGTSGAIFWFITLAIIMTLGTLLVASILKWKT